VRNKIAYVDEAELCCKQTERYAFATLGKQLTSDDIHDDHTKGCYDEKFLNSREYAFI
jgi:hypothetical protein